MTDELKAPNWLNRCDTCGWPLEEDRSAGCHEFDCSQRPLPKWGQSLTAAERQLTRDYIRRLETRLQLRSAQVTAHQQREDEIIVALGSGILASEIVGEVGRLSGERRRMREALAIIADMYMPDWVLGDTHETTQRLGKIAHKALAAVSGSPKADPTIIWMDGDDSWNKCSECDDELIDITCDGESGQRLECGTCGHQWWEGEYIKPIADDSSPNSAQSADSKGEDHA